MSYKKVKQATGYDKRKFKIGDKVRCISIYNGKPLNEVTIIDMWHQGADGVIFKADKAPDNQYPTHYNHRASMAILISSLKRRKNTSTSTLKAGLGSN